MSRWWTQVSQRPAGRGAVTRKYRAECPGHYFTSYSQAPMATFWRLFGFLRPYRRAALGSLLFAWLAMGVTVLIPLLIGKASTRFRTTAAAAICCRWRWRSWARASCAWA